MRSLVIKCTAGADDPERCNQAFTVAASGVAVGAQVSLWLTGDAAWHDEPVVLGGIGLVERPVDRERSGLVMMLETLDPAGFQRDEVGLGPRLAHGLPRFRELALLDSVGGEKRDASPLQAGRHAVAPCLVAAVAGGTDT